jgi:hypothetical protein
MLLLLLLPTQVCVALLWLLLPCGFCCLPPGWSVSCKVMRLLLCLHQPF